jgi:hypothetical protein
MWMVIGIIASIFILKFFFDSNQQKEVVQKQGGMLNKYSTLIQIIQSADSGTQIQRITADSVDLVLSNAGGVTAFFLTQTFGRLTVQWKVQSPIFGNHKMEWDFPEFLDQEKRFEQMSNDLEKYQLNVMSARRQ